MVFQGWVMVLDGIFQQSFQVFRLFKKLCIFKSVYMDMVCCYFGQDVFFVMLFLVDWACCFDYCQVFGGGDMKSVYSFVDQVFFQYGVESCFVVFFFGIRCLIRVFELQVIEFLFGFYFFQQYSMIIIKVGKMFKLMFGVSLSDGLVFGYFFIV